MEKKSYEGKVNNKGTQAVEAVFPQSKGKSPSRKTGGDLRGKGGKSNETTYK